MLYNISRVEGFAIEATDGMIGSVDDFLFDDAQWTVRWAVVDTGKWLSGRKVLLPPAKLGTPDFAGRRLPAKLSRTEVEASPGSETALPIARQIEERLAEHYQVPPYWLSPFWLGGMPAGTFLPGGMPQSGAARPFPPDEIGPGGRMTAPPTAAGAKPGTGSAELDIHLRSMREVTGYYVRAKDDDIGHIEDFLIEDDSFSLRYMVVDTRNWLPGKRVIVSPRWVREIDWSDNTVHIDLARQQIEDSPEWDPDKPVERDYEKQLHGHYGQPPYWE